MIALGAATGFVGLMFILGAVADNDLKVSDRILSCVYALVVLAAAVTLLYGGSQ